MRKVGHRGTPREFPANTLKSFARAVECGCDMVECDIRQAADGILVLAHDPEVQDITGRVYEIASHNSAVLNALNLGAGERVPTLEELVEWALHAQIALMADMKCEGDGIEEAVCAALSLLPVKSKIVPGAGAESRCRFHQIDPFLPLSLSLGKEGEAMLKTETLDTVLTLEIVAVTWYYALITPERLRALHERGLKVYAWTVDDREIMLRLRDEGVDGIISNRADFLSNV